MARKDALLRLTSRLIARRDALRKALSGDLDSFRKFATSAASATTSMRRLKPPTTK